MMPYPGPLPSPQDSYGICSLVLLGAYSGCLNCGIKSVRAVSGWVALPCPLADMLAVTFYSAIPYGRGRYRERGRPFLARHGLSARGFRIYRYAEAWFEGIIAA